MMTIGAQRRSGSCRKWDDEFGLDWNYFGARYYDPVVGRWMVPDPLADKFPGWSPYNYTLNNPLSNVDPDGREVRFENEEEAKRVAKYLNKHHEGANIGVVSRTGKNEDGKEITYYAFEIGENSTFDFGQSSTTQGLFDAIQSQETKFDVVVQTGGKLPDGSLLQEGHGGGVMVPFADQAGRLGETSGGATIYLDHRGYLNKDQDYVKNDIGVVFLHEAVGHGSPLFAGKQARDINLQYSSFTSRMAHGGYVERVKWKGSTGLWPLSNNYYRYLVNKKRF